MTKVDVNGLLINFKCLMVESNKPKNWNYELDLRFGSTNWTYELDLQIGSTIQKLTLELLSKPCFEGNFESSGFLVPKTRGFSIPKIEGFYLFLKQ